jgi:manganese-dependent inorganic pyrophosphatase
MNRKIRQIITSYKNPDLDGIACIFAYTEFLRKNNKDVTAVICGSYHREAKFVFNSFNIQEFEYTENLINESHEIILVDTSNLYSISDKIKPEKVVEIIDHRIIHEANRFPNAKVQIELVGSAATLIAEKFFNNKIIISQESATLLFSAIVSNTINFQANVTTSRDYKMANWLQTNFSLPNNYIHNMFRNKSQINKGLKEIIIEDFATFHFYNYRIGIAQLEIIEVDAFIKENLNEIRNLLCEIRKENSLTHIFLTCIDLELAFNTIMVIDQITKRSLEQVLKVTFKDNI